MTRVWHSYEPGQEIREDDEAAASLHEHNLNLNHNGHIKQAEGFGGTCEEGLPAVFVPHSHR